MDSFVPRLWQGSSLKFFTNEGCCPSRRPAFSFGRGSALTMLVHLECSRRVSCLVRPEEYLRPNAAPRSSSFSEGRCLR